MLLYIVWHILTPVFLVIAIGVVGQRWLCMDVRTLATAAFYVFTPCLVFTALSRTQLDLQVVKHIVILDLGMTAILIALGWGLAWRWGRDSTLRNACILTIIIQNAGNYGIPISQLAFGEQAIEIAVWHYVCMQISANSLGVLLAAAGTLTPRQTLKTLVRVPLLYATVLALTARALGVSLPVPLLRGVEFCAAAAIPVLLLLLGMQMAQLQTGSDLGPTVLAVGLRLVGAPLLAMAMTHVLQMDGLMRAVSICQWSVPTAITTIVLALQYDCQPRYVARVILVTTVLSVVTMPVLLLWLM